MKSALPTLTLLSLGLAAPALSDVVHTDDVIITQDLCVGAASCVDGETFGNVDIKIKSTNPEILLDDTSGNLNDWSLKGDDDAAGAPNSFSISNSGLGSIPFAIAPAAPSGTLYVSTSSNIGFGTTLPQADLHIVTSGTPEIRFEVIPGGTPYVWDIGGNDSNFFIEDATAGTAPLVIEDAAPSFSLNIETSGNIGLGTDTPTARLHIPRADGTARILVENTAGSPSTAGEMFKMSNTGGSFFTMENTTANITWFFTHENSAPNRFIIADNVADGPELTLTAGGDLTIPGALTTGGGTCGGGCDAVFTDEFDMPTIAEHSAKMFDLGYLPNVGPTLENQPINVSDKLGRMLNELEVAHIYIDKLHSEIQAQAAKDVQRDRQIEALLARLAAVESQAIR